MRIAFEISYDGTNYCGWQNQKNGISCQQILEEALQKLFNKKTNLIASGRTDAGVHAKGQIAHFDCQTTIPPEKIALAINPLLPDDIQVLKSYLVKEDFHARYGAKQKTYEYAFYISPVKVPVYERYATRIDGVDIDKMQSCCDTFVGTHDFKCFLASGSKVKDTVRTIFDARVFVDGDFLRFRVTGNGFLYNMVRIMAGTIVAVAQDKLDVKDVKAALLSGDRNAVGKTAPAKGLTLLSVKYE